jgi:eukaryotic-like serine/threonine-protein kinase
VVALVVWAALGHNDTGQQINAQPSSGTVGPPSPTASTTTTTPPPPVVAPAGLDALLPTAPEINAIPGMPADMRLIATEIGLMDRTKDSNITITPAPCYTVFGVADSHGYDPAAQQGIRINGYHPPAKDAESIESVAGYPNAAAAQSALRTLVDDWRSCGTTFSYSDPDGGGRTAAWTVSGPAEAGNGITTATAAATRSMTGTIYRAIAAKANVVVDVSVSSRPGSDRTELAVAIATAILDKIPGPR